MIDDWTQPHIDKYYACMGIYAGWLSQKLFIHVSVHFSICHKDNVNKSYGNVPARYVNLLECVQSTPLKINMEPKNHASGKENHLNQTSMFGFQCQFSQV